MSYLTDPLGLGYDVPLPSLADLHACRDGRAEPILRPVVALARREPVARPKRRATRKPKPAPGLSVKVELVRLDPSKQLALPAPPLAPKPPHVWPEPDWDAPEVTGNGPKATVLSWGMAKGRWNGSPMLAAGGAWHGKEWVACDQTRDRQRNARRADPEAKFAALQAIAEKLNVRHGVSFTFRVGGA